MRRNCIFCELEKKNNYLFETNYFFGVWDINPVQEGHLLIISKQHRMNISELTDLELNEMIRVQKCLIEIFENNEDVLGVTTLYNNGKIMMAGTHFHFHIIPRYADDDFYDNQIVKQHSIDREKIKINLRKVFADF